MKLWWMTDGEAYYDTLGPIVVRAETEEEARTMVLHSRVLESIHLCAEINPDGPACVVAGAVSCEIDPLWTKSPTTREARPDAD